MNQTQNARLLVGEGRGGELGGSELPLGGVARSLPREHLDEKLGSVQSKTVKINSIKSCISLSE